MDDRFVVETVLKQYTGNESKVVIPREVTEIGDDVFRDLTYNKHQNLTAIDFPENLRHIGKYAFANCRALTEVVFPDSLISIEVNAFANCESLSRIHIPKNVQYIDPRAFSGCKLAVVTADENNPTFHAVDNCLIETATNILVLGGIISKIPESVTAIGRSAFSGRDIEELTIPNGVCSIEAYAFNGCINSLTDLFIPESVIKIDNTAFLWCGGKKKPFTIHAPAGSYAEQYAKENNIPFVAI